MAFTTLGSWFDANPAALKAHLKWLKARRAGKHSESQRGWLRELQNTFGCPFGQDTTLMKWNLKNHQDLYLAAMAKSASLSSTAKAKRAAGPTSESFQRSERDLRGLEKHENFIVTSAVNNCHADPKFLAALEQWRQETQGRILVNKIRYKNPQSRTEAEKTRPDEWWDKALHPYMIEQELRPHPLLSFMTRKAQATANNPLPAKLDSRTQDRSAVFGHPQLSMRTVATPQNALPKILYSSGAVTEKLYSDTDAGDMAEFHHSHAAIIAEVRGDRFHLREVTWDSASEKFVDIDTQYTPTGVENAPRAAALSMGDLHLGSEDPGVMEATFGPGGVMESVDPENVFFHDTFDGVSVSPHDDKKLLLRAALARRGHTSLARELEYVGNWLNNLPVGPDYFVVPSNHDDFLDRWLQKGESGVEAENLVLYHELCAAMLRAEAETGRFPPAISLALPNHTAFNREDVRFVEIDENVIVRGIQCGAHGHLGPNGARGAPGNMSRIGIKGVYGHIHSPRIWQGTYFAGTSSIYRLPYAKGPSGWMHSHVLTHDNGYRQMLHMIDNQFRG